MVTFSVTLHRQTLQIVGLENFALAGVGGDPVGDVIFPCGFRAAQWPAEEIRMPQSAISFEIVGLYIAPVSLLQ